MNEFTGIESCNCHPNRQEKYKEKPLSKARITVKILPSMLVSLLIAFFPKCPFCWAIYMSMFGSIGLAKLPYMGWLFPVLLIFLGVHLFILLKKSTQSGYLPFLMSLVGAIIILLSRLFFPQQEWLLITGIALIISGSLLNSFFHLRLLETKI